MWSNSGSRGNQSYKFSVTPDYFQQAAQPTGSGMHFSRTEITQIIISVGVLTVAFAIVLMDGIFYVAQYPTAFLFMLGAALLAVATGFLFHELAHKRVAQKYGCFAEYRMSPQGLLLAVITSFIGFLFALPGAVVISGRLTLEQYGKISLAGPVTNLVIGSAAFMTLFALDPEMTLVIVVVSIVAFINLWLAVFNLLPIPPLDGSKIFRWSKPVYVLVFGASIALLVIYWFS